MKLKYIKSLLIAMLLVPVLNSCDDYLDVNKDPNNPTEVPPNLILAPAQTYTAAYLHGSRRLNHLGNMFMYNWSESNGFSWYNDEFQYLVTTTFYAALFDNAYANQLKQYHILTELGPEYKNYQAIGKIMKAYHFQILVDLYGSVPYFEALGRKANASPKYDDGQVIYDDLLIQLNDAITLIKEAEADPSSIVPAEDDVMFDDMMQWIQFANTIKLRILTRMSDVAPSATITSELQKIGLEGSGFIVDDVIVNPGYLKETNKQNPFWNSFGAGVDGTTTQDNRATPATQFIIDHLMDTNDPRIDFLYSEPPTGHLGVDQIAEPGFEYAFTLVSRIGPGLLKSAKQGSPIFTLAEHNFNLAELALKGFGGDAEAFYNAGISASFDYLDAPGASAYADQDIENVGYAYSTNKLEAIMTQKWLAVNGITAEQSWFDYSRTGYPIVPIADEASTSDRPVRLFYPASELSSNAVNVPDQPDAFTSKIFWAN